MTRPSPSVLGDYARIDDLALRWDDVDVYGHVNNAVHYRLMDTAVCGHLVAQGVLDPARSPGIFLVVASGCDYFSEVHFPGPVGVGLRVDHLGRSSVRSGIGIFAPDSAVAAAQGTFTHVLVSRAHRRPLQITGALRHCLAALQAGQPSIGK